MSIIFPSMVELLGLISVHCFVTVFNAVLGRNKSIVSSGYIILEYRPVPITIVYYFFYTDLLLVDLGFR